jgi:hypothetical protein
VPKIGKTSLAAEFPDPVFLQVEEGTPGDLELTSFGQLTTFDAVLEAFTALIVEEHDYKTVVIDSLDAIEPLVWAEACRRNGWQNIEAPGYGKGYVEAEDSLAGRRRGRQRPAGSRHDGGRDRPLRGRALRAARHGTLCPLQPEAPQAGERPGHPGGRRHRLHRLRRVLKKTDAGFGKKSTHAEGGGTRVIHLEERPSFAAGNRYGMPARLPYKKGQGYAVLAPYLPSAPAPEKPAPAPKRGSKATPETATSESE